MPVNEAIDNLHRISAFYPNATISITGGEPTQHPNYYDIIQEAVKIFKNVVLTSNGVLDLPNMHNLARLTKNPNFYIQISLDGDEKCHDLIRGIGTYRKTLSSIEWLCNNCRERSVSISTTVSKLNKMSIFHLAEILNNLNIDKWRISLEQIFEKESYDRNIPIEEWNDFVDEILPRCRFKVNVRKYFDFELMKKSIHLSTDTKLRKNCGFGEYKIYIYPDFSVIPCTCMSHLVIGNLNEDSIDNIAKKIAQFKPECLPQSVCSSCEFLKICNGGCVGYSYHYNGEIGMGDIRCPKIKNHVKS